MSGKKGNSDSSGMGRKKTELLSPKQTAAFVEQLWERGLVEEAMATFADGLKAVHPNGKPDLSTRARMAETIAAYAVGLPIKRQEIITHNVPRGEDLERQIASSPAFRSAVRRTLDRLESLPVPGAESPASGQGDAEIDDSDLGG